MLYLHSKYTALHGKATILICLAARGENQSNHQWSFLTYCLNTTFYQFKAFELLVWIIIYRIKFQWSKDKQNRVRPSASRSRRKSHKPNNKLRPERTQPRYSQDNESASADNVVPSASCSDVPTQHEQKRISRHGETLFIDPQTILQPRRPSHKSHEQRRCSRKSEVSLLFNSLWPGGSILYILYV